SVEAGETVAILGQSGSGKSTLLSLLAGLDAPTNGAVEIAGRNVSAMPEAELARFRAAHLGIVFQQFHLMSYLSALENVQLPLEIAKVKDSSSDARSLLGKVGLGHRLHHVPAQLSGGEKQRVAIARAMIVKPQLLLADEPSGNLDRKTGDEVMELLFAQVRASGMAMILVTHNEQLANLCARKLELRDGRLRQAGA
ncbi:MAG TPA: ABC transporter ATP-binding protein, partial [Bdellovibrionales bacterium]|nr:ABC transporter ATP-binding protein [Bdellovibrionales bacterium]